MMASSDHGTQASERFAVFPASTDKQTTSIELLLACGLRTTRRLVAVGEGGIRRVQYDFGTRVVLYGRRATGSTLWKEYSSTRIDEIVAEHCARSCYGTLQESLGFIALTPFSLSAAI